MFLFPCLAAVLSRDLTAAEVDVAALPLLGVDVLNLAFKLACSYIFKCYEHFLTVPSIRPITILLNKRQKCLSGTAYTG